MIKTKHQNKRQVLKNLFAGAGAVAVWKTPIVNSVVLPAHASTSCDLSGCFSDEASGSYEIVGGELIHHPTSANCTPGTGSRSIGAISTAATVELAANELSCVVGDVVTLSSFTDYNGSCTVYRCLGF